MSAELNAVRLESARTGPLGAAFTRWLERDAATWASYTRFRAAASRPLRHALAGCALRLAAAGGDALTFETVRPTAIATAEELLALDRLLKHLEAINPRRCRIVECRVFAGMSAPETARALDLSAAAVEREWRLASVWLYCHLARMRHRCGEAGRGLERREHNPTDHHRTQR